MRSALTAETLCCGTTTLLRSVVKESYCRGGRDLRRLTDSEHGSECSMASAYKLDGDTICCDAQGRDSAANRRSSHDATLLC